MYYGVGGGVAGHDGGGPGDEGRDPHVRRQGRDGVLLLVVGRSHGIERGRLRARAARTCNRATTPGTRSRRTTAGSRAPSRQPRSLRHSALSAPVVDVEVVPTASGRPASVTLVKKTGADDPAQGGRCARAARPALDRASRSASSASRALRAATARERPSSSSGLARDVHGPAAREARRERRLAAVGQGRRPTRTAPSPSPSARRSPPPTGSPPKARQARPDDHRPRGTGEVTARAAALVGVVALGLAARRRRRCAARFAVGVAPHADRAAVAQAAPCPRRDASRRSRADPCPRRDRRGMPRPCAA